MAAFSPIELIFDEIGVPFKRYPTEILFRRWYSMDLFATGNIIDFCFG